MHDFYYCYYFLYLGGAPNRGGVSTWDEKKNGPYLEALLKALLLATTASDDISVRLLARSLLCLILLPHPHTAQEAVRDHVAYDDRGMGRQDHCCF
jgi:hypothetical protein